jgi:hypothetical protein
MASTKPLMRSTLGIHRFLEGLRVTIVGNQNHIGAPAYSAFMARPLGRFEHVTHDVRRIQSLYTIYL